MTPPKITAIAPEQEALLSLIRDEWMKILLETTPTDKQKAETAIALVYESAGLTPPPQILWFKNPAEAATYIAYNERELGGQPIWHTVKQSVWDGVAERVRGDVAESVRQSLRHTIGCALRNEGWARFCLRTFNEIYKVIFDSIEPAFWESPKKLRNSPILHLLEKPIKAVFVARSLIYYNYLNAIGIDCSPLKGLWAAAQHCGWWWAFENLAIVTPKPSAIRLDSEGRLHAEGEPAVAYEGFQIYAHHGVRLPEKYGAVSPENWQARWLLEEKNAEIRRVLIQGIGYDRLCREIQATELDSYREYTLLKIDSPVDVEPIYLLKMTCPSTEHLHVLRVPPDVQSALEAITWVNWGISPEAFAIQT